MEIVKIRCSAAKEGFLWAVRNGRFNRMQESDGTKAWAKKEDAIKAIERGLKINEYENLIVLADV